MFNGFLLISLIIVSSRLILRGYFKTCNNIQSSLKNSDNPNYYLKTLSKFDILITFCLKPFFVISMMTVCIPILNNFEIPELKYTINFEVANIDFIPLILSILLAIKVFQAIKNVYISYAISFASLIWAYHVFYTVQNKYLIIFIVIMASEYTISFFMEKHNEK
ncbi:hypothetical protein A9267_21065 [Shewanella sp. UCD-FRSSP16_17]|uniref:hypothetical protein n=1 Tax=Shewanella sp. UCD-FRSSP16_17 TaxID=1853256 RepID=UPI0007EECD48|nr:hypothetical protein [Shewanella sp. UCD-FRSSP16_17]OBT09346.1 hypothetical protein A9267_21065 [Shewanella sp. UCD-FRSSP16_17]